MRCGPVPADGLWAWRLPFTPPRANVELSAARIVHQVTSGLAAVQRLRSDHGVTGSYSGQEGEVLEGKAAKYPTAPFRGYFAERWRSTNFHHLNPSRFSC